MLQNLNWTPLLPNSLNVLYKDVLTSQESEIVII